MKLDGKWKVALTEIDIKENLQKPSLYVKSDLCQSTIVDGNLSDVLRKVNTDVRRQFTYSFDWLYHLQDIKNEIREIQISIRREWKLCCIFI